MERTGSVATCEREETPSPDPPEDAINTVLDAASRFRGAGGLVVIEGPPGAGTTHLFSVLAEELHRRGWRVIETREHTGMIPTRAVVLADGGPAPTRHVDEAVVFVSVTSGLAWGEELTMTAARLLGEARLSVVRLSPLLPGLVAGILRAEAAQVPDADVEHHVTAAAGNPLIATHLARHGHLQQPALDRVVLNRILARFGPGSVSIAAALAALQSVTLEDLPLVAQLCDVSEQTVDRLFDSLSSAGLIASAATGDEHHLTIPWMAEALYAHLGPATRDRIHRCAADALSRRSVVRHDLVAHHLLRSSPTTDPHETARLLSTANALTASAPDVSVQCYQRALTHLEGTSERTAELTALLARAYLLAGRPQEAADVGRALLTESGNGPTSTYPWLLPVVAEAMKATSAVDEAESILRAHGSDGVTAVLATQVAYLFAASGRDVEARDHVRRARSSLTRRSVRGQVNVLSNLLHAQCIAGDFAGLRHDADQLGGIIKLAPEESQLHAWATLAHVQSVEGDLAASAEAADNAEALLAGETWGIYVPEVRYARAAVGFAAGAWDDVLTIATASDAPLSRSGTVSYLHLMRHVRGRVLANRGEFTQARKVGGGPVDVPYFLGAMRNLALAEVEMLSGSHDAAGQRLNLALTQERLPGEIRAALLALLASVAVVRKDDALVRACVAEVEERWGIAEASRQVRLEMLLALATVNQSTALARDALSEAQGHGFKLFEGRAQLTLGQLEKDPEEHFVRAMNIFGDLKAVPWRRTTASELRSRGLKVPRRSRSRVGALTETEVQLARLVQAAHSNREIAEVMSLSVKTVEVYLSRLYAKTNCKSRLDLARAADEGRLPLN